MSKALRFSVLHARHVGVPPLLGQTLPGEFDLDDYPGLLDELGLTEDELTGVEAVEAVELTRLDADPHGQFQDSWPADEFRAHRREPAAGLDEPSAPDDGGADDTSRGGS